MDESQEEWRAIAGYAGYYEVSNLGRVRSLDRIDCRGQRRKGKVLKPCPRPDYAFVGLCRGGRVAFVAVHRLVMAAFVGPVPEGMEVNHIDRGKTNNALWNLEYVTRRENVLHAYATGTRRTRIRRVNRLSRENVEHIRELRGRGVSASQIARLYQVTPTNICRLTKDVPREPSKKTVQK